MRILKAVNLGSAKILEKIIFVFALVMVLSCFAQICTRLLGCPLSWSEELARYMAIWLTFLGAAYALRKGTMATVEILYNKLHGVGKKTLYLLISAVTLVFCYALIRYGWEFAVKFMPQASPAMHIPKGIVYLSAPISGILMACYQIELLYDQVFHTCKGAGVWER